MWKPFAAAAMVFLAAAAAWADGLRPECSCRYFGNMYPLGTAVCVHTNDGPRMAVCETVLNNTSWRITTQACRFLSQRERDAEALLALAGNGRRNGEAR